jgi:agmatinase
MPAGPRYGPPDASKAPRYTGVRTFARCPASTDWPNAHVAVIGVPFDTATSYRPGPRFGPAALRDQSQLLRPWHPALGIDVFATLSVVDGGDLAVTPGNAQRTTAQIAEGLGPVIGAGAVPLVLGGDHSIVLGELRAHARAHGPVGVVLLDAHPDTWDAYYGERYFHGTPFRRALEEGLIDPGRSLLAGMRGPLYSASDLDEPRSWGFEIVPCDELRGWTPSEYGARVRERLGDGPAYLSDRKSVV